MQNYCGTSRIAGCSFSVYPMADRFKEIILEALEIVDTSKVWMETDDVTTLVRGRIPHVFDVTSAIFLAAAKDGEHVVFNGTYSIGCPGDSTGDVYMAEDEVKLNFPTTAGVKQLETASKFSLYPLGGGNYMDTIYSQIENMRKRGITVSKSHYSTRLDGNAIDVFEGLEHVFTETESSGSSHTVMTVTMSANSPSAKGVIK
ncbi:YkoF family thiamine/hydroxymethylpyrimidine-binding protein [Terribacillus sp. 179-K 1B1 HS]|uniref:YkoF family thiamine/hydroxymethylpyrimidine-binding protein n=1 Tax=Terribacillus sp. 179-K 1B1 HS TaxID=3142388 RepID=UPI00399FCB8C